MHEIFQNGFTSQGSDTDLQKHLSFVGESGYISVTRSLSTAQDYAFGRQASQQNTGYIFIISPENLPDGHWIPGLFPKDSAVQRNQEFAVPRQIPASAIAGAYKFKRKHGKVAVREWTANTDYRGGAQWKQPGHAISACKLRFCSWAHGFSKNQVSRWGMRPGDAVKGSSGPINVPSKPSKLAKSTNTFVLSSKKSPTNDKTSNVVSNSRGDRQWGRIGDKKPDGSKSSPIGDGNEPPLNGKKKVSASSSSGTIEAASNRRKAKTEHKPAGRDDEPPLRNGKTRPASPSSDLDEPPRNGKKKLHKPSRPSGHDAKPGSPRKKPQGGSNSNSINKNIKSTVPPKKTRGKLRLGLQNKSPNRTKTPIILRFGLQNGFRKAMIPKTLLGSANKAPRQRFESGVTRPGSHKPGSN
ncbi:putative enterotoxin [Ophiocordyceps australis]|uniref:Putative enterotoxin n=1 Tax=Ophiocordyceps australis TaxID=1399860 RepID=A0A2C5XQ20_9HYPO|nr:putative enterotoxin [Ophiocordyceps australis]